QQSSSKLIEFILVRQQDFDIWAKLWHQNKSIGIEGLWLGLGAQTGEAIGSMIEELTGSEVRIGNSVWTTRGWTSLVLPLLLGCTMSLVASVSHFTTREVEVVGIVGPGYAVPLRVVIPFRSSFGLVIVL
nr:hypothetical protein [Tanacetum cinerariifolium]